MDLREAGRILDISECDNINEIKRKYRRLMGRFHPDALGSESPEHIRRAQEINEAYRILKKSRGNSIASGKTRQNAGWMSEKNEKAFCPRNIYLYYSMETEAGKLYYKTARGKYMWDPDEEEFHLFIASLSHAAKELLEQVEEKASFETQKHPLFEKTEKFKLQAKLVHCLIWQYTNPVKILRKIAEPEECDNQGRPIYHFPAFLEPENNFARGVPETAVKAGGVLYPKGFRKNRIMVSDRTGRISGYLSFADDCLYLCVIPLLKSRAAQVKMSLRSEDSKERPSPGGNKMKVDFYFRLEKNAEEHRNPDQNLRIAGILREYESKINGRRTSKV